MYYNYIKAVHLIFVITWFAGLFYIPRLFVYQIEAFHKPSPEKEILGEQLKLMAKRLWYIITWPSGVLATIFAIWLLVLRPDLFGAGWMHVKLLFVLLLFVYHYQTHVYFKQMQNGIFKKTSSFMRLWNEGATFILFAVIFLAILKNSLNWVFGVVGLIVLALLIVLGYKVYKNIRAKNPEA